MDTIINDNSDDLFDNFIDKNVYLFTCDSNNFLETKEKYELRMNEIFKIDYIIENI